MAFFRPAKENKAKQGTAAESDRTEMLNFSNSASETSTPAGGRTQEPTKPLEGFDGQTQLSQEEENPFGSFKPGVMEDMDDTEDEPVLEGVTKIVGVSGGFGAETHKAGSSESGDSVERSSEDVAHPKGPVTAWLVVIHGPELGESFALRHGPQIISRGDEADVPLKDAAVSRNKQATVHYDPNMAEFSLNRGQATPNMYTARNGKMSSLYVGMNHILELGDEIIFGDDLSTRLRFVPLCGEGFSWRDLK
jgi:hypothetical protein